MNQKTDSLNTLLASTRSSLDEVTDTKNKISVLGLGINKGTYNAIMWTVIAGLLVSNGDWLSHLQKKPGSILQSPRRI
ncbi:MAG: hypothetical protein U5L72_07435 [Bacteroidales bacterium]|nr:hypothetical protein [Bacteroidales bacterium]